MQKNRLFKHKNRKTSLFFYFFCAYALKINVSLIIIVLMENIKNLIIEQKLITPGEIIGVGVSGGKDSMALLHYLHSISMDLDFEVVGVHVDHCIREDSGEDARFVLDFCKTRGIRSYKFRVDAKKVAAARGLCVEEACREARYGVFEALIAKGIVDKIALAHHKQDQAETVLMRLFRGTGVGGAKGMTAQRDSKYIRPMIETSQQQILDYIKDNGIDTVFDSTNDDNTYNRNFIRNQLLPMICERWPNAVEKICSFAKFCYEDDAYINSIINEDSVIYHDKTARVPLSYLYYPAPLSNRLLLRVLKNIGAKKDIEKTHLDSIIALAKADNGKKLNLPFDITCIKEYDYLAIVNKFEPKPNNVYTFKSGEFDAIGYGRVITKKIKPQDWNGEGIALDGKKLPKGAMWRYRKEGDIIEKFGGGTVKLKKFFIDKKIPSRLRDYIPVLAAGDEVFAVAGVDISEKVKIDQNTTTAYQIKLKK